MVGWLARISSFGRLCDLWGSREEVYQHGIMLIVFALYRGGELTVQDVARIQAANVFFAEETDLEDSVPSQVSSSSLCTEASDDIFNFPGEVCNEGCTFMRGNEDCGGLRTCGLPYGHGGQHFCRRCYLVFTGRG